MKLYNLILSTLFVISCYSLKAQKVPAWVIQASASNNTIAVNWYPTDPSVWKEGLTSGYTLTRETISGGGAGSFSPVRIMLKDSTWFRKNMNDEAGVLAPVGQIIYSNNFLRKSNRQNDELQYNYIVYESTTNMKVAEAIGLGFVDKSVAQGATYRYTVKHNKSGQTVSVTVKCDEGAGSQEPKDYQHNFHWPDGASLGDMLEQSKPFVLEAIIGKARPKMDSVILRWVPTTIDICRKALTDGYEIWRAKGGEDSVLLATVRPWTEAQLRQMPRTDTLALLAAAFVMDQGIPQGIAKANMFDRAAMERNYFGFAMTAADRSSLAADILGLRYVDREAKFGETYRYEIRSKRLAPNFPVPEIWVTNEFEPLVAPENFKIDKNEKSVTLKWFPNSDVQYSSYIIERLNPGDSVYHSLTAQPLVFIRSDELKYNQLTYIDSLPANNQVYMYRIKGSNAFGEWSDYAYGHGFGRDITPPAPVSVVTGKYLKEDTTIRISWTVNTKDKDLKYHQILVSDNADYNFSAISGELSPKDTVSIMDLKGMDTDKSFYFKVNSVDSSGNISTSLPRFVFVPDHVRPEAPASIRAGISPEGWVTVSWSPSVSKDVVGYYVFFSNNDPRKLALQFDKPLKDTTYSWQIDMKSLTKYLYVGVKSEDDNYNRSFLTEILQLRRPDTIAPVSPYLSHVAVKNDNVEITWKKSGSHDVEKYLIFSRSPADSLSGWIVVDSVAKEVITYRTQSDLYDGNVQYAVKAVDDYGNQSDYSNTGQVYIPFPGHKFAPQLNKLSEGKNQSVAVSWQKDDKSVKGKNLGYTYQIFRSVGSHEVTLYKESQPAGSRFEDTGLEKGVLYNYAIRVRYDNGWTSALSEVKSILIK